MDCYCVQYTRCTVHSNSSQGVLCSTFITVPFKIYSRCLPLKRQRVPCWLGVTPPNRVHVVGGGVLKLLGEGVKGGR